MRNHHFSLKNHYFSTKNNEKSLFFNAKSWKIIIFYWKIMDFHDRAPRVGGSDFGVCENFAYRVRDFFFCSGGRGGGTRKNFSRTRYAKIFFAYPSNWGGRFLIFFQKLGLRDSAYPVRLFRNVEYAFTLLNCMRTTTHSPRVEICGLIQNLQNLLFSRIFLCSPFNA